jgi:hypothetical protein
MPNVLDNGQRSPRKLLRALKARLLGRTRQRKDPRWRVFLRLGLPGEAAKTAPMVAASREASRSHLGAVAFLNFFSLVRTRELRSRI